MTRVRAYRAWARKRDGGVTLVELMVGMAIMTIVLGVTLAAFVSAMRTDAFTSDDSEALAELRLATDRFSRELREARLIYPTSTTTAVRFWIDLDRDNQQDVSERVTWAVRDAGGRGELVRTTADVIAAGGQPTTVASYFALGPAFAYTPALPGTTTVTLTLTVDNQDGQGGQRSIRADVRPRNITG